MPCESAPERSAPRWIDSSTSAAVPERDASRTSSVRRPCDMLGQTMPFRSCTRCLSWHCRPVSHRDTQSAHFSSRSSSDVIQRQLANLTNSREGMAMMGRACLASRCGSAAWHGRCRGLWHTPSFHRNHASSLGAWMAQIMPMAKKAFSWDVSVDRERVWFSFKEEGAEDLLACFRTAADSDFGGQSHCSLKVGHIMLVAYYYYSQHTHTRQHTYTHTHKHTHVHTRTSTYVCSRRPMRASMCIWV